MMTDAERKTEELIRRVKARLEETAEERRKYIEKVLKRSDKRIAKWKRDPSTIDGDEQWENYTKPLAMIFGVIPNRMTNIRINKPKGE